MKKGLGQTILRIAINLMYAICTGIVTVGSFRILKAYPESRHAVTSVIALFLTTMAVLFAVMLVMKRFMNVVQEKDHLEDITDSINRSLVILWTPSFRYIKVNPEFINVTGYDNEDLSDPDIIKKVLPPDAFSPNLQSIVNSMDEDFPVKCKRGSVAYITWRTSVMMTGKSSLGEPLLMSIGIDVTENHRMRSELMDFSAKLSESENRYSLSMELSDIGLLLKDHGSSRFYVTDKLCDMLGLTSCEGYVESDDLRNTFHPKDKIIFDSFVSGRKNGSEQLSDNEIHSVDFRAVSSDGQYHWYNFRYRSVTDSSTQLGGAVMDITKDKEKDIRIERMAYVDEVTGIYNRNKFMQTGNELLECGRTSVNGKKIDYWIIVIDIDSFHIINDICGYASGNHLLCEIGAVLSANLTEGGFTARIGGDNFALIVRADEDDLLPVRLIRRIQQDISGIGGKKLETQNITCSAGYCLMSDSSTDDFAQVLDKAEFALSLSDGTRSFISRYDNSAHDSIIAGNEIEKDLTKALDNHELVLYYQPKINLENGRVMGMEALIRWIKPDGTIIPPSDFIPVAESSLLITNISRFVLHEACRQNKEWQDMGLDPVTVSINLSAIDFYQTNVTESIHEALSATGLDPQWLDVELTESLALRDIDHAVSQMKEIKELGVKLSMDDFGTGYSSLSYIQILPITILKLDRSFIMYLEEDEISREIVSAVIRIAKSKKIETIAEGIETVGQAEILKRSGCDHAQGYFFGKPMPAKDFENFLRQRQQMTAAV